MQMVGFDSSHYIASDFGASFKGVAPDLYTELAQPDMFFAIQGDLSFHDLVEDARQVAIKKKHLLMEKIMREEVLPKSERYWLTC